MNGITKELLTRLKIQKLSKTPVKMDMVAFGKKLGLKMVCKDGLKRLVNVRVNIGKKSGIKRSRNFQINEMPVE